MKQPRNRKKVFRVDCVNCHATQDSLRHACSQCKNKLYTNMEADEMAEISQKVDEMELILGEIDQPKSKKGNPYEPVDKAWEVYRGLRVYHYLPGMLAYLDTVLEALLPSKVRLLERTAKANWLFMCVLGAFPIITLLFRMHLMVVAMLALPAIVWLVVATRATRDLKKTKEKLSKITGG